MDYDKWIGTDVYDNDNNKVGSIKSLYVEQDDQTPVWMTIKSGLFGTRTHFAPIKGTRVTDDGVVLAVSEEQVKEAPSVEDDEEVSDEEESRLYEHYGGVMGTGAADADDTDEGEDASGPETDDAMTRSEEELHVGKTERVTARLRLRKYVVTEDVHTTVPVTKEKVRVEREPITDENRDAAMSGGDLTSEEHDITLKEEVPVIDKKVVPKERVKLTKDVETDEVEVDESVRKEKIDLDGDDNDK